MNGISRAAMLVLAAWLPMCGCQSCKLATSAAASNQAVKPEEPAAFRDGSGTDEQAEAWARTVLNGCDEVDCSQRAIGSAGPPARFYCFRSSAGSGGNQYAVFLRGPRGLRYAGTLSFGEYCMLSPDSQKRPRVATLWYGGCSEGFLSVHVLTDRGFQEVSQKTVVPADVMEGPFLGELSPRKVLAALEHKTYNAATATSPVVYTSGTNSFGTVPSPVITLTQTDELGIDPVAVHEDCTADLCRIVRLRIGDREVRLLGFAPSVEKVQTDYSLGVTSVSLCVGTHLHDHLVVSAFPKETLGVVVGDKVPTFVGTSRMTFEEIRETASEKWTVLSPDKVYVDPQFYRGIMKGRVKLPDGYVVLDHVWWKTDKKTIADAQKGGS